VRRGNHLELLLSFWAIWFYNVSSRVILSPILPIIEKELGIGHGGAGGIFGFVAVGYGLALLFAAPIIRWAGSKRLLILGHLLLSLLIGLFPFGKTYGYLACLGLLIGFSGGIYLPCSIPLLAARFSSQHWAKVLGFHETATSFSFFMVPLMLGVLSTVVSSKAILVCVAGMGIPLLWPLIRSLGKASIPDYPQKSSTLSLLRDKRIWSLGILYGIAGSCNFGVYAVASLFLVSERGFQLGQANQLLGISRIGGIFVPFLIGLIADKIGYARTLTPVIFLSGLFTVLMSLGYGGNLLLIILFLQASVSLGFMPLSYSLISKTIDQPQRGAGVALVTIFGVILGLGLSPWLLGMTADYYSFSHGFIVLGAITMITPFLLRAFR
jgi:MFS transporter, NNP family, nitrate/nitrite transporter